MTRRRDGVVMQVYIFFVCEVLFMERCMIWRWSVVEVAGNS